MPATFRCSSAWASVVHAIILCAFHCGVSHAATSGRVYTLEAYARDAGTAVFVDDVGAMVRVEVGQMVADSGWRLLRIDADAVDITAGRRLNGDPVTMRVRRGDRFSPELLNGRIDAAGTRTPQAYPMKPAANDQRDRRRRER